MSKSIASQVRSMAKKKMDKRISECANQIISEMSNDSLNYIIEHDFPTEYNRKVLIVLDDGWHSYTFTEIRMASETLGLYYDFRSGKNLIIMPVFSKGKKATKAQELYKKMRSAIIGEIKVQSDEECAEQHFIRNQNAYEIQQACTQANAYFEKVLNELKAGNFYVSQYYSQYHIFVRIPFQESKYISAIQKKQVEKVFEEHHFYHFSLTNSYCEFVIY